ncbi:MAG: 23S rRNA (pseudouridine(1915)-N(3))-methyltransferase RlmH [Acidobacteriaceae bacterium]|nr:23S rRNA (pseudouridine(1915)-N(3))-methyltransferase RlmH [Acidobacteriaceae bacterium]
MRILLSYVGDRPKEKAIRELFDLYLKRATRYLDVTEKSFSSTEKLLSFVETQRAANSLRCIFCDPRGKLVSSEDIAEVVEKAALSGVKQLLVAIGPANGWTEQQRVLADQLISLGRITLPHELCLLILMEQVYRALTIRAGHPYHSGH